MVEEDLPQVRKLNNQFVDAVGEVTKNKMKYLFDCSLHAFVVKDQETVVAFCLTHGSGLSYNSKNYVWHSENSADPNFVYMDRIVVHSDY